MLCGGAKLTTEDVWQFGSPDERITIMRLPIQNWSDKCSKND